MRSYLLTMLHGAPTGRLLVHDPADGSTRQLADGLWFANGCALAPDESFVAVRCRRGDGLPQGLWPAGCVARAGDAPLGGPPAPWCSAYQSMLARRPARKAPRAALVSAARHATWLKSSCCAAGGGDMLDAGAATMAHGTQGGSPAAYRRTAHAKASGWQPQARGCSPACAMGPACSRGSAPEQPT